MTIPWWKDVSARFVSGASSATVLVGHALTSLPFFGKIKRFLITSFILKSLTFCAYERRMLRYRLFNRVEGEGGFVIKLRPFNGFVEYREGRKTARVPVQPIFSGAVGVYMDTPIEWNPPFTLEAISEEKRIQMLKNIVEALRFRKYKVEVVQKTKGRY